MAIPHIRTIKDWGYEIPFANSAEKNYCGKELGILKNYRTSLHKHPIKDETFYVIAGVIHVEMAIDDDPENLALTVLQVGEYLHIPTDTWHRMIGIAAPGEHARLIEVSTFHSDDDVVRWEVGGPLVMPEAQ